MEKYTLENDISTFYITAQSFPAGVMEAHNKLHALLSSTEGRNFYGISYPDGEKGIVYKAAVEEAYPGEAEELGCSKFLIKKGEYNSELLTNWMADTTIVGKTFQQLLAGIQMDARGYCLEIYLDKKDMRCLVILE